MNLSFYIARRYFFARKSHHVINTISAISVCGVALASMALICTLSVYNGFSELVASLFTQFDPQLKITAAQGKIFNADTPRWDSIRALPQIECLTRTLEDNALVQHQGNQMVVTLKGVEDNFDQITGIRDILVGDGEYKLTDNTVDYAIPGVQLFQQLGCGLYFADPLEVYVPKHGVKLNVTNPTRNFNKGYLYSPGLGFMINQEKYDAHYIITNIGFLRRLLGYGAGDASAVELKLKEGAGIQRAKQQIKAMLGGGYRVEDRYEQQHDVFKVMRIEKFISYLFLTFILMIACFNVIGSLSMLIIDKRRDVQTLRNLGANDRLITQIFLLEGGIISMLGAAAGLLTGIVLCLLQMKFGLIGFGDSAGSFITDAYPVSLSARDVLLVFVTVIAVSVASLWLPVKRLTKRIL